MQNTTIIKLLSALALFFAFASGLLIGAYVQKQRVIPGRYVITSHDSIATLLDTATGKTYTTRPFTDAPLSRRLLSEAPGQASSPARTNGLGRDYLEAIGEGKK
jgi:hypothetical protein